ncbi:hypothetical protein LY76DRAFT_601780 [Colletotrichum caudatum]|nr:hypothetical protein LY76DRAFT_601780 [Colletotrichum caudatum]
MDSFLDLVGPRAEKMLDLLIDLFGIVLVEKFGLVVPVIPLSPPNQAVCDPNTCASELSKDGKKKSSFEVAQMKKVKKLATQLRRKTSRLEYRHRQEHKTNPRPTKKQQNEEQSREVEKLKSRIIELGAYLRTVEESRAELLQCQTTWTYPYDKDLEIPGRIPTICARLPVPEFRISDVIDRRKPKPAAPFNITFYSMPDTIIRPKASTPAARSLPSADKTTDQPVKQPVTSLAVVPSSVHSPVQSLVQSSAPSSIQSRIKSRARKLVRLQTKTKKNASVSSSSYAPTSRRRLSFAPTQPIAIPTVNLPDQIPKHTESPVTGKSEPLQPDAPSVPLPKSPPQPLAQSPSTPPSLIHPNSQIAAPDSPAVSKNNREVSQKGEKLAEESEKDASDYSIDSGRDGEENRPCSLPSLQESDEGDDSDTGSDGEVSGNDHNNRPNNAGSVAPSVIQQLAETSSHSASAKEPPSTSFPVPTVIKHKVQGPSITPLGDRMEVDIQNENGPEEDRAKIDAMDVDVQNEASGKECATAKTEMEVDAENDNTKDETGKDKMQVDIENETGATKDEMQLDDLNPTQGLKDVDMPDVSQKTPKPTSDDIEMRDGSIPSIPNVIDKQNNQHTTAEQPSTPVPNGYRPQQVTPRPQASNVSDETMSDKASSAAPRSEDQRQVIVIRRRPADPMVQRKPRTPRQQQRPPKPTTPTPQAGISPTVCIPGPPSLVSGAASEGTVTLFQISRARSSPKPATPSFKSSVRLFPDRPARKHKYDEMAGIDEDHGGDADLSMLFDVDRPPRKILPLPKRALQTLSAADDESRRQRALEAKRRWRLVQEQEAAAAPDPATEQFRDRPPPMVASQGVSARDNRLLLSESTELRKELLYRLQALWPLLPKAEVDRVRLNNLRSKSLAEWRKLLNPAGRHTLPENTYISRNAFEREAVEWMKKVVEPMTKLKVVPEVGSLLETWREMVARREPLPEPGEN